MCELVHLVHTKTAPDIHWPLKTKCPHGSEHSVLHKVTLLADSAIANWPSPFEQQYWHRCVALQRKSCDYPPQWTCFIQNTVGTVYRVFCVGGRSYVWTNLERQLFAELSFLRLPPTVVVEAAFSQLPSMTDWAFTASSQGEWDGEKGTTLLPAPLQPSRRNNMSYKREMFLSIIDCHWLIPYPNLFPDSCQAQWFNSYLHTITTKSHSG